MKVITRNELEASGGLYITNVIEGTNRYPYGSRICTEEQAIAWILALAKEHGLYADFYAGRIGAESIGILKGALSVEEMEALYRLLEKCRKYEEEFILFSPNEEELTLLVKLSHRELLFSTFYMTDPQLTIWSNYDGEYIVFANKEDVVKEML